MRIAGDCLQPLSPGNEIKKDCEDTKGCDLRFDLHQTLEPAAYQFPGILKNIPYENVAFSISVGFNLRYNVPTRLLGRFSIIFMEVLKIKLYTASRSVPQREREHPGITPKCVLFSK